MTINTVISHLVVFEKLELLLSVVKSIIKHEHFVEHDDGLNYHGKCPFPFCPGYIRIKAEPMNDESFPCITFGDTSF